MEDQVCFGMEKRLWDLDPALHRRFTDAVSAVQGMLPCCRRRFPEYNDHSGLHSMGVMEYCNLLAGKDQILLLNGDELYILLMACLLHDAGLGVSDGEFDEFMGRLEKMREKIQETLDLCREAAMKRSPFRLTRSLVVLKEY
jgi:hypothetical protein